MKYFSKLHPIIANNIPKGWNDIVNFDVPKKIKELDIKAYGVVEYEQPLTEEEIQRYELISEKAEYYICLMTIEYSSGEITRNIKEVRLCESKPEDEIQGKKNKVTMNWILLE